jgi:tetratricopeptide (TPR) repeat protein
LHHVLSIVLERQGKIEDATAAARRVIEIDPSAPDRHARLALLLMRIGCLEEAEKICLEAACKHPNVAQLHDTLSLVLEAQGRLPDASAEATRAVEAEPDQAHRHARAASLLLRREHYGEAEQALRGAISLFGDAVALSDLLSVALERQKRIEEAAEETRRGIDFEPANTGRYLRLGQLLLRARRPEEAEAALREGLAGVPTTGQHPHRIPLRRYLCDALEMQKRTEAAAEQARAIMELEPGQPNHVTYLADILLRARKQAEAAAVLQEAVVRHCWTSADSFILHIRLGYLLESMGELEEAQLAYEWAVAADPDSTDAQQRLASIVDRRNVVPAVPTEPNPASEYVSIAEPEPSAIAVMSEPARSAGTATHTEPEMSNEVNAARGKPAGTVSRLWRLVWRRGKRPPSPA